MKLLIDARNMRASRTGIGYYCESVLRAMDNLVAPDSVQALSLEPHAWDPPLRNIVLQPTRVDYQSHPAAELHENLWLPRMMQHSATDVFWGPAYLIPWVKTQAAKAVTIHDLTVFTHPEAYPRRFASYMRLVIGFSVRAAQAVICISQTTANDLRRLFPALKARVEVVHAAADPFFFAPGAQEDLPPVIAALGRPYILVLGAGDPRKNTQLALNLFERLIQTTSLPHSLVVVGSVPKRLSSPRVHVLPRQDRQALRALYRNADLFLLPSAYEGFGLPLLEAMASNCPVLASKVGALSEVGNGAADFFDLAQETQAVGLLEQILSSPGRQEQMRAAGLRRAREFSWEHCAQQLLHLFEQLANRSNHAS